MLKIIAGIIFWVLFISCMVMFVTNSLKFAETKNIESAFYALVYLILYVAGLMIILGAQLA